jgi:hypothetical protein
MSLSANALYLHAYLRDVTGQRWTITLDEPGNLAAECGDERVVLVAKFNGGNPMWIWREAPARLHSQLRGFPARWERGCE